MADRMSYVNGQSCKEPKKSFKKPGNFGKMRKKKGFNAGIDKHGDVVNINAPLSNCSEKSRVELKKMKKKKRKSKMGCPIIVEDNTVGNKPSVRIPVTLRHAAAAAAAAASVSSMSDSLEVFGLGNKKRNSEVEKNDKVTMTQVDCINPSEEIRKSKCEKTKCISDDFPTVSKKKRAIRADDSMEVQYCSLKKDETVEIRAVENTAVGFDDDDRADKIERKRLPRFYSLRNKVLAIVEPDCSFCFNGKLKMRVLYGAVRIYGAYLNSSRTRVPVAVYSPRAYSAVAIEAVESEIDDRCIASLWESLAEQCADRKFAKRLETEIERLEDGWSVLEMENFENHLTSFLTTYCPYHLFPRIEDPSNHSWKDARRAEIVLQANLRSVDSSSKQLTIGSRGLDDFAEGICYNWETKEASRTIIAGGKGVGKSTTARYLVNKLLAKSKAVLVLDLDIGQAEFTPAGSVSLNIVEETLLGPNFTHLKTPHYQIYVGSPDVTRSLTQYVDAARKLVDRIHDDAKLSRLPLVVNTMGFCKGIGWDIMSYIIKILSPTDVLQILSKRSKNNFDDTLSRQVIDRQTFGSITWGKNAINRDKPGKHRLHVIYSEAETGAGTVESWNLEAHQQRDLVMLAYLSQIVDNDAALFGPRTLTSPSINAVAPYVVSFSAVSVALAGALIPQVLSVMNGNIVALCGVDPQVQSTKEDQEQNSPKNTGYPRVVVRPPLSTCYGFGILRGVDMEKEQLFVNTPLSSAQMQHVNCLVGCINLPPSLLQLNEEGAPYTGSEYDLPTSRGARRGYYRMRYQVDS